MKPAIQRVTVDFTVDMLKQLDSMAKELNISRQAVIKTYLRQAIDRHYLARKQARAGSGSAVPKRRPPVSEDGIGVA